jgi:kynurenine formamidase
MTRTDYLTYRDEADVEIFGRKMRVLDLSHELSPEIPVYPGHMKVAMWTHLSHEESRMRIGDTHFCGYSVMGISMCDHDSTHMDAVSHFNADRPDLSIDKFPIESCFTKGVWVDVSHVRPRTHITLDVLQAAMDAAGISEVPEGGSFLYYTGASRLWSQPLEYCSQYPGLDAEASKWILEQGVVNILTDAISTDNPADPEYPNHTLCGEYLVNHSEAVANIDRIPVHSGFWVVTAPLRFIGGSGSPMRAFAIWES